jgi:hypothetical protein
MSMISEFKAFAMRGNVVDLAVGVVIGGAFGKIVTSLVDQIIMPPIGWLTGGIDFSAMKWVLKPGDDSDPKHKIAEVAIQYGARRPAGRRGPAHRDPRFAEEQALTTWFRRAGTAPRLFAVRPGESGGHCPPYKSSGHP